MTNNPNLYSQTATADTATISAIRDGADFPHSGLIKALSDGLGQNYAISGFNVTATSETAGTVASGVIMRDGKKVDISTGAPFSITLSTSHTNGYHLLVVNSSDAVVLRNPTDVDKVPAPTAGDTIIGVATHTGANPFSIQYLTVNKTSNGLTVGFDSSGYTEVGEISATSASQMLIQTTASNADIKLLPHGSGDIVLGGDMDVEDKKITTTTTNGGITIEPNGSGKLVVGNQTQTVNTITSNGARDLKLEANSGTGASITIEDGTTGRVKIVTPDNDVAEILLTKDVGGGIGEVGIDLVMDNSTNDQTGRVSLERTASSAFIGMALASDSRDGIRFLTGDGSETERVRIAEDGDVDIKGDTSLSRSLDTGQTRTLTIEGARNAAGSNFAAIDFKNYDSHGPTSYVGARISATNESTGVDDGSLIFSTNNANAGITERMRIRDSGEVGIGLTGPDYALDVNGSIRRKGNVQAVTTIAGSAPLVALYNILSTDDVILASAPSGTPPNNLTLHLPDASVTDIGRTYRIVATDATNTLALDRLGSTDAIHGPDDVQLTLPYSLSGGKIYDVICVADNKWMLLTLN